jgi:hypothetical protein
MKRLLLVPAMLFAVGAVQAAENSAMRSNVGVGLGTMLFEAVESDGLLSQTLAATTNGIFLNQLFFVTSGTGGAKKYDGIVQNRQVRDYIASNMDVLARDMAAGQGESLAALAELAGIADADRPAFYATVQRNFSAIFTGSEVTSDQVVENLAKVVA